MKRILSARHFELNAQQKEEIQAVLSGIEQEHPRLSSARVVLNQQNHHLFDAEILIRGKHLEIEAECSDESPEAAFAAVLEKIERQLDKHYDKVKDHHNLPISQLECEIADAEMELVED